MITAKEARDRALAVREGFDKEIAEYIEGTVIREIMPMIQRTIESGGMSCSFNINCPKDYSSYEIDALSRGVKENLSKLGYEVSEGIPLISSGHSTIFFEIKWSVPLFLF